MDASVVGWMAEWPMAAATDYYDRRSFTNATLLAAGSQVRVTFRFKSNPNPKPNPNLNPNPNPNLNPDLNRRKPKSFTQPFTEAISSFDHCLDLIGEMDTGTGQRSLARGWLRWRWLPRSLFERIATKIVHKTTKKKKKRRASNKWFFLWRFLQFFPGFVVLFLVFGSFPSILCLFSFSFLFLF